MSNVDDTPTPSAAPPSVPTIDEDIVTTNIHDLVYLNRRRQILMAKIADLQAETQTILVEIKIVDADIDRKLKNIRDILPVGAVMKDILGAKLAGE